jgi:hypothetical protein
MAGDYIKDRTPEEEMQFLALAAVVNGKGTDG